jgi:hypothetical protein
MAAPSGGIRIEVAFFPEVVYVILIAHRAICEILSLTEAYVDLWWDIRV